MSQLKMLKVSGNIYDVFVGEGWYGWTRIVFNKAHNEIRILGGQAIIQQYRKSLFNLLKSEKEGTITYQRDQYHQHNNQQQERINGKASYLRRNKLHIKQEVAQA